MYRILSAACLAGALVLPAKAEILVEGAKRPLSAIVVAKDAPSSVKLAATDLQASLKKVGLGDLPIRETADGAPAIYLGDSEPARKLGLTSEKPDSFFIRTDGESLVIAGKDYKGAPMTAFPNPYRLQESHNTKHDIGAFGDTGTLFGVYHFLEKYVGVRWYMPGELGTVWPAAKERLELPKIAIEMAPHFTHRHAYYGFFDRSEDDSLWYRRSGYGSPYPMPISHSFAHFFLKYKDTNPEYFALIDGQRDFGALSTVGGGNYDLNNEAFIQQVIKDANQYFRDNPEQMIFPLVPNDGMERLSEDPATQAMVDTAREKEGGKFSNYMWGFINKVAEGVAKEHPDRFIGGLAYSHYGLPPNNIEKMHPNVVVMVCKLRRGHFNAEALEQTRKIIAAWQSKVDYIYNWEYYCDILLNGGWKGYPVFFPSIAQQDLKELANFSRGEFIEAESWMPGQYSTEPENIKMNFPGLQHIQLYVTARLLWDPNLDVPALLSEYYRLFYGPAEKEMGEFWTKAEKAWMAQKAEIPADFFTPVQMADMVKLLETAKEKTEPGSVYRQRVDLIFAEFTPATERAARLAQITRPMADVRFFPDGIAADADWVNAPAWSSAKIIKLLDTNYLSAKPPTHVRVGWTKEKMLVAFSCFEPEMANLITRVENPDEGEIWMDDSVEVFLMKPGSLKEGIQFIVNSNGVLWDGQRDATSLAIPQWKSTAKATAHKEKAQWNVLIEIPWSDLGVTPEAGMKLKANFYRNREVGKVSIKSSWAPLMENTFYQPKDFGTLVLEK